MNQKPPVCRVFRRIANTSPMHFLSRRRLDEACHLLRYTDMPITDIAQQVGYSDPAYFNRLFKRNYGKTPGSLRRETFDSKGNTA